MDQGLQPVARADAQALRVPIDLYQADDIVVFRALIPGARLTDVDLMVDQNTLRLAGQIDRVGGDDDRVTWFKRGISRGRFAEIVALPAPVDFDRVAATYADGVLTVLCPLAAAPTAKRIPIQSRQSLLDRG
jgi:HSP20 family protein